MSPLDASLHDHSADQGGPPRIVITDIKSKAGRHTGSDGHTVEHDGDNDADASDDTMPLFWHGDPQDTRGVVRLDSHRHIATGSRFSIVYSGTWIGETDRAVPVALKMLRDTRASEQLKRRLVKEIRVWSHLHHENLQPLYGTCEKTQLDGRSSFFVVGPLRTHGNAMQYLKQHPEADRVKLLSEVANAVAYLHAPSGDENAIVHGDINGESILISDHGTALLGNFGLRTVTETVVASQRFMAPEIILSEAEKSTASDVWAFGMVIYQLYALTEPFASLNDGQFLFALHRQDRPERPQSCDETVWDLASSCWEEDPHLRPLMHVLKEILQTLSTSIDSAQSDATSHILRSSGVPDTDTTSSITSARTVRQAERTSQMDLKYSPPSANDGFRTDAETSEPASGVASHLPASHPSSLADVLTKLTIETHEIPSEAVEPTGPFVVAHSSSPAKEQTVMLQLPLAWHGDANDSRGTIFHSFYRRIGRGGFSDVFAGIWQQDSADAEMKIVEHVAVKRMNARLPEKLSKRFNKEVKMWSSLKHKNSLPLLGTCQHDDDGDVQFYLISPLMKNGSVVQFLLANPEEDRMLRQIADALVYLHTPTNDKETVIHGDIKGDNVLISDDGTALLADFGLSVVAGTVTMSASTSLGRAGTDCFKAPELLENDEMHKNVSSDVYAFGMLIYQLYAGEVPFYNYTPRKFYMAVQSGRRPERPPLCGDGRVWATAERCWAQDAAVRPTMDAVAADLE